MEFGQLHSAAPEIAARIQTKLEATGIGFLATIRSDGSPRVSPIEVSFQDGHLFIGMMPGSYKAVDLLRDERCSLVTPLVDKDDLGGEGKIFARARTLTDPTEVAKVLSRAVEGQEVDPADLDGSHAFELLIEGAAWQRVDDDAWVTDSWSESAGVRHRRRQGANGEVVDVA